MWWWTLLKQRECPRSCIKNDNMNASTVKTKNSSFGRGLHSRIKIGKEEAKFFVQQAKVKTVGTLTQIEEEDIINRERLFVKKSFKERTLAHRNLFSDHSQYPWDSILHRPATTCTPNYTEFNFKFKDKKIDFSRKVVIFLTWLGEVDKQPRNFGVSFRSKNTLQFEPQLKIGSRANKNVINQI